MEEKQALTSRKRKRYDWWQKHAPKDKKVKRKSEKPLRKKEEKKEKAIKVADDTEQEVDTSTLKSEDDKSNRYILFIGNLPFTVNEDNVRSHFRCTGKDSIKDFRLMTKKTGESKGCGFLEFDNQDSYWKALNLHHSVLGGRKINVEVTCGGGGKGEQREKKLKERKAKFRQKRKRKPHPPKTKLKQKDNPEANASTKK